LAMLPLDNSRFVSIFCIGNTQASSYMEMDDESYISKLQEVAGTRIGNIQKLGKRKSYPLKMIKSEPQFCDRLVLLGNSAHTIHPNGAQGFNLGLRDAASLAEVLITNRTTSDSDVGSDQVLEEYINFRQPDHNRVVGMSDGLTEIFYTDNVIKKILRNSAMSLLNMVPAFKYKFARIAMGVDGRQPSLVRGLLLDQL
jgi:2-octaprenyl-6-methoxyphenol hydroxylase